MMRGWLFPDLDPKPKTDYWLNIWNVLCMNDTMYLLLQQLFLTCFSRAQKKLSCSLEDLRSEPVDKVSPSDSP